MMPKWMAFDKHGNDLKITVYASTKNMALEKSKKINRYAYSVVRV